MRDGDEERLDALTAALLRLDGDGRITGPSVHLHVLRSARAVSCRTHAELPVPLHAALVSISGKARGRHRSWAQDYALYLDVLTSFAPLHAVRAGMVYDFPDAAETASGAAVAVTAETAGLLEGGLDEWLPDARAGVPMAVAVEGGRAVAVCASAVTHGDIHCAGVETVGPLRGRGYGARAVRAWAGMVRSLGAEPFYGTTFDNVPSQALAHALALRPFCSQFSAECRRDRRPAVEAAIPR